jgi:hypothetical protein
MPFAIIKLVGTEKYTMTNADGAFDFELSKQTTEIELKVLFVACHQTITHRITEGDINKVYIKCDKLNISEVVVEGLTAKQILEKAIDNIPNNYSDSNYISPSFYRQYKKVNGAFKNFIEAEVYVMFNLLKKRGVLNAKESVAVSSMRKSRYYKTDNLINDDFTSFISENFVYNLKTSSVYKNALKYYDFTMDTTASHDEYIINYTCSKFTSENHGVYNRSETGISDEGWERGRIVIDAKSFAFKELERFAYRYDWYNYPNNNNFVLPERRFFEEFIDGYLKVEYKETNGKWFLDKLMHSYTNEFFKTGSGDKAYVISEFFEWYSYGSQKFISNDLVDKLYFNLDLFDLDDSYTQNEFKYKSEPPFYFHKKKSVIDNLK